MNIFRSTRLCIHDGWVVWFVLRDYVITRDFAGIGSCIYAISWSVYCKVTTCRENYYLWICDMLADNMYGENKFFDNNNNAPDEDVFYDGDETLALAQFKCMETGTLAPLLKEELKFKILAKCHQEGKELNTEPVRTPPPIKKKVRFLNCYCFSFHVLDFFVICPACYCVLRLCFAFANLL